MNGDVEKARRLTSESLHYGRALNSPWHIAIPISVLGIVSYEQGNLTEAYEQLKESLTLWRSVGDPRGLVFCMLYLGMTAFALNDLATTRRILEESNAIAESKMDRWAHAFGLDLLGMTSLSQGECEEALSYFRRSSALSQEIGDPLNGTQTLIHMGQAYGALQSYEDARQLFLEAYINARQARWTPLILNALLSYAELPNGLPAETKLAVAYSVLAHSAVTPSLRARGERMRDGLTPLLSAEQVAGAVNAAREKSAEDWASEILG
jgi:tetratricopeptide (TPR) repeat protein